MAAKQSARGVAKANEVFLAGAPRRPAYDWSKADQRFAGAWEAALDAGTDALEDEAYRLAHEGSRSRRSLRRKIETGLTAHKFSPTDGNRRSKSCVRTTGAGRSLNCQISRRLDPMPDQRLDMLNP
jgi:hypothetical protein